MLKYYSTMSKAVAKRLEQLMSLAGLRSDGDHMALLAELRRGVKPRLARAGRWYDITLVHLACEHGWLDFLKSIVHEHNCDPHAVTLGGATPLHYACQHGRFDIVHYLISEQHCDPDCCDIFQQTLLHYLSGVTRECTQEEAVKIMRFLFSIGKPDVNGKDRQGDTALLLACRGCLAEVACCLMTEGHCDVTIRNKNGDTALHVVSQLKTTGETCVY